MTHIDIDLFNLSTSLMMHIAGPCDILTHAYITFTQWTLSLKEKVCEIKLRRC